MLWICRLPIADSNLTRPLAISLRTLTIRHIPLSPCLVLKGLLSLTTLADHVCGFSGVSPLHLLFESWTLYFFSLRVLLGLLFTPWSVCSLLHILSVPKLVQPNYVKLLSFEFNEAKEILSESERQTGARQKERNGNCTEKKGTDASRIRTYARYRNRSP